LPFLTPAYRPANQLPFQIEKLIVQIKRERPSWGGPKLPMCPEWTVDFNGRGERI